MQANRKKTTYRNTDRQCNHRHDDVCKARMWRHIQASSVSLAASSLRFRIRLKLSAAAIITRICLNFLQDLAFFACRLTHSWPNWGRFSEAAHVINRKCHKWYPVCDAERRLSRTLSLRGGTQQVRSGDGTSTMVPATTMLTAWHANGGRRFRLVAEGEQRTAITTGAPGHKFPKTWGIVILGKNMFYLDSGPFITRSWKLTIGTP